MLKQGCLNLLLLLLLLLLFFFFLFFQNFNEPWNILWEGRLPSNHSLVYFDFWCCVNRGRGCFHLRYFENGSPDPELGGRFSFVETLLLFLFSDPVGQTEPPSRRTALWAQIPGKCTSPVKEKKGETLDYKFQPTLLSCSSRLPVRLSAEQSSIKAS